ncbi:14952_t:CDS:2, partial [Funneliformis caledonium]
NIAWELVDFLQWSMVYAKDFGSKDKEHRIYKTYLEAINNNPNLLENCNIGATQESARRVLNNFKEEANSDKVTSLWQNSLSFLNMLRTAVDLNTNKILNRVSDLHDDVSQTIFNVTKDKLRFEHKRAHFYEENSQESPPKKTKADYINDENTDNLEERDSEESGIEVNDAKEFEDLSQDEIEIRNKLLKILVFRQEKDIKSRKNFMTSIHLNRILDFSEDVIHKQIKNSLDINQFTWLEEVLRRKSWDLIPEFSQYINQFTEDECIRAKIPTIVRKSCIIRRFDPSYYEAHDIAQQILTHFHTSTSSSVHLEAPIRVESKSLDLERMYAIDTTVYILNRLFRMHQDVLDVRWIELTTPDTKQHKIDRIFKIIKTTQKSQAIIIVEFSFARKAPEIKEDDGYIIIKYLVRLLPSIYILQQFIRIKIPVSFDDFEQFAKDMVDLMNWQADVLSTIKGINKSTTKDNHIHTTTVQDTLAKAKKAEE